MVGYENTCNILNTTTRYYIVYGMYIKKSKQTNSNNKNKTKKVGITD